MAVHAERVWKRWPAKLDQSPATDAEARVFRRLYFAQTEAVDVDRNGRILFPERLVQFAGLKHEVVLLGVRDHLELWDADRWQQYLTQNAPRFDAVAEAAFQKLISRSLSGMVGKLGCRPPLSPRRECRSAIGIMSSR